MVRVLALAVVVALGGIAAADKPDPEGAKLFEQGRALAKEGKYAEACETFKKSLALDPAIGTQLNYADCHEKLGQNAEAWRLFDAAADAEKITNPQRAKYSRERADALLPKLGVVVLEIGSPGAKDLEITVNDHVVKPGGVVRELVDPGEISVDASARGATPFHESHQISAGETVKVAIPAFPDSGDEHATVIDAPRRRSRVFLAYGLGGAGVLMLTSGIVVGLAAKADYDAELESGRCMETPSGPACTPEGADAQNRARRLASVGTVLGVGGVALAAAAAVVFFTAPRDLVVTPTASSQAVGLGLVGNF
jgi:tetratricopeptide (TPR) repeat protein